MRAPANALATQPYPISALAFPISALAFPIGALAFPGAPSPPTSKSCNNGKDGKGDHGDAGGGGDTNNDAGCKAQIDKAVALNPDPYAQRNQIFGIQPGLLRYIYNLPSSGGDGETIGIVVAYDNPHAESDLATYRATFGLPPCTTSNGCFRKMAGSGTQLPAPNAGWSIESSLDLDAVSATCPSCHVLLVEAASNLIPDLGTAVDQAVANGATVVSNSYGVAEAADNVAYASHFQHPGVPITAAAGDLAYGVQFPASVPSVTAVGGTSVIQIGSGAIAEVVWPLSGSGCSTFFAKPTWQHDPSCPGRAVNDVAMLADPADGISVYDSTLPGTVQGGWSVIGGTSLGAPLVASFYALAASGGLHGSNADVYAASSSKSPLLLDIVSGNNGTCAIASWCTGGVGYDGPTGNGVAWTVGAFAPRP